MTQALQAFTGTPCADPRHEALAHAYVNCGFSRAAAAAQVGIAKQNFYYAFNLPDVQRRVRELMEQHHAAAGISARRTMIELGRIAFGDIRDVFDENGNLLPVQDWDADAAARISSIDVETRWEGKGENAEPVTVKKIRTYDKMAALGILAKHFKLVGDEGETGVNALASALASALAEARRRRQAGPTGPADSAGDVVDVTPRPAPPAPAAAVAAPEPAEQLW
jgi:phage terminase small subunit